ncbi:MAG: two-component system, NtrC family, C4-dicarboxylate transport sensor histidine kinase DctB, partial [Campylobacterota bacterium]|nr:two-component system, NtrC family, C4-dicarboxylate transport sensor histidine kinase DctB [Campylobacterota bacterium]
KILIDGDKTVAAFGYKNELAQVIINILNNAKDEIEKKGENQNIIIKISKSDKCALIEIEDHAGGIDEAIIDKIFEQYFSTKTDEKGTGIGLYMSKMIIEDGMNGKIEARNKKDEFGNNIGAIFTIKLPKEDSIICK